MRFQNILWALSAMLLLTSCQSPQQSESHSTSLVSESSLTPVKGQSDPAKYRYIQLHNGLKVVLLSDPDMTLSYASLSVSAGYYDDPHNIPGLAHLYEHMMSKGSKKYPQAAEYKQFLADHGGASNASTHAQMTNYYLKVSEQYFPEALDRFSWQFIAPLLPNALVYKERNAVQAEYLLKYNDRYRRKREVLRTLINPAHPYRKFSTGNLDTLTDQPDVSLAQSLRDFGEQHYCPKEMTAVLAGPQSLNQLALLAKSHLLSINHQCSAQQAPLAPPFLQPLENKTLNIKSLTSKKYLTMAFHVADSDVLRAGMMDKYIEWLLETYNPNGLESQLKQAGYIKNLRVSSTKLDKNNQLISIAFSLTKQGLSDKPYIIDSTLKYLKLVREGGRQTYAHFANLKQQKFDLALHHKSAREIRGIPETLLATIPAKVLTFGQLAEFPGKDIVNKWLQSFTKRHMLIINEDKNLEPEKIEPIYQTRYEVKNQPNQSATAQLPDFQLPAESKYTQMIDDNSQHLFRLTPTSKLAMYYIPQQVKHDSYTAITLYVNTDPHIANFQPLNRLFELRAQRAIHSITAEADAGDIDVSLDTTDTGLKIQLHGRKGNWPELVSDILAEFTQAKQWDVSSKVTLKTLKRYFTEYPGVRLHTLANRELAVQLGTQISAQRYFDFSKNFTEQQYQQFVAQYWQRSQIQAVIFGDITIPQWAETKSIITDFSAQMIGAPLLRQLPAVSDIRLKTVLHNGSDNAINLAQIPQQQDVTADAQIYLLAAILKAPFFHQLRTLEQLGYSVNVKHMDSNALTYLNYYVQSPVAESTTLLSRVNKFTQWAKAHVAQMRPADFAEVRNGVINALKQHSLNSETIDADMRANFRKGRRDDYSQQLIEAIETTEIEPFKAFAAQLLDSPLQGVLMQSTD